MTSGSGQSPECFVDERDGEIGDADVAREAVALGLGERLHGLAQRDLRVRPVHQQKVDVVEAELGEARLDRAGEIVGLEVLVRDLGGDEELRPWQAGGANPFADAALAPVFARRIDMAIAGRKRRGDELAAVSQRARPESDHRHRGTVRGQPVGGRTRHRGR